MLPRARGEVRARHLHQELRDHHQQDLHARLPQHHRVQAGGAGRPRPPGLRRRGHRPRPHPAADHRLRLLLLGADQPQEQRRRDLRRRPLAGQDQHLQGRAAQHGLAARHAQGRQDQEAAAGVRQRQHVLRLRQRRATQ